MGYKVRKILRWVITKLTEWLDRTEEVKCTGISASWCPICGDCTCQNIEEGRDDWDCPLHGNESKHTDKGYN